MTPIKFNDPAGTADQIQCENICGVEDQIHGNTDRKDLNDIAFDVYYVGSTGANSVHTGMPKCFSCTYIKTYLDAL